MAIDEQIDKAKADIEAIDSVIYSMTSIQQHYRSNKVELLYKLESDKADKAWAVINNSALSMYERYDLWSRSGFAVNIDNRIDRGAVDDLFLDNEEGSAYKELARYEPESVIGVVDDWLFEEVFDDNEPSLDKYNRLSDEYRYKADKVLANAIEMNVDEFVWDW